MASKKHDVATRDTALARIESMTEAQVLKIAIEGFESHRKHEEGGALAAYRAGAALNEMRRRCKLDGVSFNGWLERNESAIGVDRRRAFRFMELATQVEQSSVARAPLENTSVRAAFAAIGKPDAGGGLRKPARKAPREEPTDAEFTVLPDAPAPQLPAVVDPDAPPDEEDRSAEQDVDDLDDQADEDEDEVLCDECGVEPVEIEGATCTPCINKLTRSASAAAKDRALPVGVDAEPDACAACGHPYKDHVHPSHYPGVLRCEADGCEPRCESYRPTMAWLEKLARDRRGRIMTNGEAEILASDNVALRAELEALKAAPPARATEPPREVPVPLPTTAPLGLLAAPGTGLGAAPVPPPTALPFLEALAKANLGEEAIVALAQLRAAQGLALLVEAGIYRLQAKEIAKVPGRVDHWELGSELDGLVCKVARRFKKGEAKDEFVKAVKKGAVAGGPPALSTYQQGLDLTRKPTSVDLIRSQVVDETHPFLRPAMRSSCMASPEQTALLIVRDAWSRIDGLVNATKAVRVPARRSEGLSALRDQLEPAIAAATQLVRAQHGEDAPEPKPRPVPKKKTKDGEGAEDEAEAEKAGVIA